MFLGVTPTILRPSLLAAILKPQDVFATSLWTDNGNTQAINNGLDLAGKGGLVWTKSRSNPFFNRFSDTVRGPNKELYSNDTSAEAANGVTAFGATGFTSPPTQSVGATNVSWAFAFAPKFCVAVTWTGDGTSNRQIPHGLGVVPGFIITKIRLKTGEWSCTHRSLPAPFYDTLYLNYDIPNNPGANSTAFNGASSTTFTVGNSTATNQSGQTYVAYLIAHDPSADGIVQCGSFTTGAGGNPATVTLPWMPQFLLAKRTDATGDWIIVDTARGWGAGADARLFPNLSAAESAADIGSPSSTGFTFFGPDNATYIYLAIRAPY